MSTLLVTAGILLLWYLLDCWCSPWSDCWWCHGSPKRRAHGRSRRTFRYCLWPVWLGGCGGSGKRRRVGSLVLRHGLGKLD